MKTIKPSNLALIATGILNFIIFIVLITQIINNKLNFTNDIEIIKLIVLVTISIGIHGMLHILAEMKYNYNPLESGSLLY